MNGLKSRLQAVDGIESIELELGADGLEGITVRLAEGADEGSVLENVRRLLVAYGTSTAVAECEEPSGESPEGVSVERPPRFGEAEDEAAESPDEEIREDEAAESPDEEIREDEAGGADTGAPSPTEEHVTVYESTRGNRNASGVALGTAPDGELIHLEIRPGGDSTTALVAVAKGGRAVRRQVPASPKGIVQAVIDAGGELMGRAPISVIGLNVSTIDRMRILTVIVGNHAASPTVCTASVVESDWPAALVDILGQVLRGHTGG